MKLTHWFALLAALMLIAASCSSDGDTTEDDAESTTTVAEDGEPAEDDRPTMMRPGGRGVAESELPMAIISLSPTATEMLYAIGAGDQVLAVDDFSNYPAEAAEKMQGLSGFDPNVEAIAALEPDLIVTDGTNPDLIAQFDDLGIAHWEGPAAANFDDIYAQLEQLGAATGNVGDAAELISSMQTRVESATAAVPEFAEAVTYYHELDPTFFSVSPATFIGSIYTLAGLENIVPVDAITFPQLSQEFIVDADPDMIFLACTIYCGETAESVGARDGWADIAAVQGGLVIEMNDDVASRWGPRSVDYLEQVVAAVESYHPRRRQLILLVGSR